MFENAVWSITDIRTWAVILTGLLVVFCMLLVLIIAIKLVGIFCQLVFGKGEKKDKPKKEEKPKKVKQSEAPAPAAPMQVATGEDPKVIAAISAAVYLMLGHSSFQLRSVKKRAAKTTNQWKVAGRLENVRPF